VGVELVSTAARATRTLWADADPDRVGQVIANLIENALKFAASRVEVGVERIGEWIALWVADDGPGVSPDDLPHIFERHYSSDRVPARKLGVGLGLAIVAELASAMGGVVDAQSPVADGRGARMVLWLHRGAPTEGAPPAGDEDADNAGPRQALTPALPLHPPM
jgi:signal transduction histidine kinase